MINNTFSNLSGNILINHYAMNDILDIGTTITQSDARFFMNLQLAQFHTIKNALFDNNTLSKWGIN